MILDLQSTDSKVDLDDLTSRDIVNLYDNAIRILTDDGDNGMNRVITIDSTTEENLDTSDLLILWQDADYIKKTIEAHYAEYLI